MFLFRPWNSLLPLLICRFCRTLAEARRHLPRIQPRSPLHSKHFATHRCLLAIAIAERNGIVSGKGNSTGFDTIHVLDEQFVVFSDLRSILSRDHGSDLLPSRWRGIIVESESSFEELVLLGSPCLFAWGRCRHSLSCKGA